MFARIRRRAIFAPKSEKAHKRRRRKRSGPTGLESGAILRQPANALSFTLTLSLSDASFRVWRMGGDSNPRCLSAHTLSRRAQSTTLSPIRKNLPLPLHLNLSAARDNE